MISPALFTTNINTWQLIDDIWTADRTQFSPWIISTKTTNGNDDQWIQVDNFMIIDLTM